MLILTVIAERLEASIGDKHAAIAKVANRSFAIAQDDKEGYKHGVEDFSSLRLFEMTSD